MVTRSQIRWTLDDIKLGLDRKSNLFPKEYPREMVLIDDVVNEGGEYSSLEGYLSTRFPKSFRIAHYPGARTLVVRGTKTPVQLPAFDAKIREANNLADGGVSIEWTVR